MVYKASYIAQEPNYEPGNTLCVTTVITFGLHDQFIL